MKHSKKKWLLGSLIGILLMVLCAALFLWSRSHKKKNSPEVLFAEGQALAEKGEYQQALIFLLKAQEKLPDNIQLLWRLACIELRLNNDSQAQKFANQVWKLGKKDRDTFLCLIDSSGLPSIEMKVEYGQRLLKEISVPDVHDELQGDMFFALKKYEKALNLFEEVYQRVLTPRLALKVAITLVKQQENVKAVLFLEKVAARDGLDEQGFTILMSLKYLLNQYDDLQTLFSMVKTKKIAGPIFLYRKAYIQTLEGQLDQSLATLKECLAIENLSEKEARQSRLFQSYIFYLRGNTAEIESLKAAIDVGESPESEAEFQFYTLLLNLLNVDNTLNQDEISKISSSLYRVKRLMPENFIIQLINARVDVLAGHTDEALKFYESEQQPMHRIWSRFIMDNTIALQASGDFRQALDLVSTFHGMRKKGSLESFILQRNLHMSLRDYTKAVKLQELLIKTFPQNKGLILQSGYLAFKMGDFEKAEAVFKEQLTDASEQDRYKIYNIYNIYFETLLKQGKAQEVYAQTEELIEKHPQFLFQRASAANKMGNTLAAEKAYRAFREKVPGSESDRAMAFFKLNQQEFAEAEKLLTQATKQWPNKGWSFLGLAVLAMDRGEYDRAQKWLLVAEKDKEEYESVAIILAEIDYLRKSYYKAIDRLELLEISTPGSAKVHLTKALCLLSLGDFEKALLSIDRAQKIQPLTRQSLLRCRCLINLGKYTQADKVLQSIETTRKNIGQVLKLMIDSQNRQGNFKESLSLLEKYKKKIPLEMAVIYKAIIDYSATGHQQAILTLESHLNLPGVALNWIQLKAEFGGDFIDVARQQKLSLRNWLDLANNCLNRKDYFNASQCYTQIYELLPNDVTILNNHSWCLYKVGQYKEALDLVKKAHRLNPRNSQVIDTYSKILMALEKYQACLSLLRPIASSGLAEPELILTLGLCSEKTNKPSQAIGYYKKVLALMDGRVWKLTLTKEQLNKKLSVLQK
jgi:tetratricopeptide (TPR) repeat protein